MMKTINSLITYGTNSFVNACIENPRYEAELLLSKILHKERHYLYMYPEKTVDAACVQKYIEYVKRRSNHEPVAYIINEKEFMCFNFFVNNNVLIPRSDTESVVEGIINKIFTKINKEDPTVLDLCAGSGAIGLSIAKVLPNAHVTLSDVSHEALEVAMINAKKLSCSNVKFVESNLFENFKKACKYDLIISNPPYIATEDSSELQRDILDYEPHLALFASDKGYEFYYRILENCSRFLSRDGFVVLEIGDTQEKGVRGIFTANGFNRVENIYDLTGKTRALYGRK